MATAGLLVPQLNRSPSPTTQTKALPSSSTATTDSHRHSLLSNHSSSAASYRTAPLSTASRSSLASTSSHSTVHTTNASQREADNAVPSIYTREVHVVAVPEDALRLDGDPLPDGFFQHVGKNAFQASLQQQYQPQHRLNGDTHYDTLGSPPGSAQQQQRQAQQSSPSSSSSPTNIPAQVETQQGGNIDPPVWLPKSTTDSQEPRHRRTSSDQSSHSDMTVERQTPTTSSFNTIRQREYSLNRSSTDTKASYTTLQTIITGPTPPTSFPAITEGSSSQAGLSQYPIKDPDGLLHPPSSLSLPSAPARRNTTGSTPLSPKRTGPGGSSHVKGASQPMVSVDDTLFVGSSGMGEGSIELATDIERHAERIRRERMSKRAKQEAEAAVAAAGVEGGVEGPGYGQYSAAGQEKPGDMPLVGNLIGEDHVNYVLMYNMLTGIRIGVSRCGAKMKRALTDEDFTARHKYSFDIVGNELTPSAKYDFKFKDYAPWVFRTLREDIFHLDPADYLLSLTSKYILSELGSPGKSGSFFYFSRDYRFIIKTIHHSEHKYLLSILKRYHSYVTENPHTLLSRFYGLHRVKLPRGRKIHFVIMNNLFPPHKDIHETYDLKGSTVGREYPEDKARQNPRAVLKDLNWINRGMALQLGPEKRALLAEQLRRDAEFLKSVRVMDYSLLVGTHNMQRGNRDKVRKNTLKVFSPDIPDLRSPRRSKPASSYFSPSATGVSSPEAIAIRRAMRSSDPKRLGRKTIRLPESDTGAQAEFIFYQDEGGLRATDEGNEAMDMIYYLGVIDILTPYTVWKRAEHVWKGLGADIHKISPVPPAEYADRFFAFMKAIMRGGEGGESFKPKAE